MRDLLPRDEYLKELINHKDVDVIKIVTGIRRCGKSSLLDLYHQYLLKQGVPSENIIHMNLESLKFIDITDFKKLYSYVTSQIPSHGRSYLIFVEIQVVDKWEKAIESFRIDFDVDIYITGSNAYLLSSDLATYLSGRYVQIQMLPLSFKEFINFNTFDERLSYDDIFKLYIKIGGMPVLRQYHFDELSITKNLSDIFNTVIVRDAINRNEGCEIQIINKIMRYLCSTIGSTTSPNNIANVLKGEGEISGTKPKGIASKTVERYIQMLRNAYIIYSIERYDIKGKQLLKTLGKNYVVDIGFRNILLGYKDADRGHIIENIVFLELIRRGYKVYIGKVYDTEIDFIAEKTTERLYIQVTESLVNEDTKARELRSLKMIPDNHEKMILSMDHDFNNSYDGIKSLNLIDWLLEK